MMPVYYADRLVDSASLEDRRSISLISEYPSFEMAQAILASPDWEAAQQRAGVIGGFEVKYFDRVA